MHIRALFVSSRVNDCAQNNILKGKFVMKNKPWLHLLISSQHTSPRIRSFWLYNIHVGSGGSQARLVCHGVTMSSTENIDSWHFNSGTLNLMFSCVLKESGSFKALKYRTAKKGWCQFWVLAPVLPVGKSSSILLEPVFHPLYFQALYSVLQLRSCTQEGQRAMVVHRASFIQSFLHMK